jgi:hypothetical protein
VWLVPMVIPNAGNRVVLPRYAPEELEKRPGSKEKAPGWCSRAPRKVSIQVVAGVEARRDTIVQQDFVEGKEPQCVRRFG